MVGTTAWEWHSTYPAVQKVVQGSQEFITLRSASTSTGIAEDTIIDALRELRYKNSTEYPDEVQKKKYAEVYVVASDGTRMITYPDLWSAVNALGK